MDPETKHMLDAAFAQHDEALEFSRQLDRKLGRQPAQVKNQLIYKNYENTSPQQQQEPMLDEATSKLWDQYIDGRINIKWNAELSEFIKKHIDKVVEALAEEIAEAFSIERKRTRDEMSLLNKELIAEIEAVRADATIDRALRKEVIDLPKFVRKRDRDAA
jgi:hypothetical protein